MNRLGQTSEQTKRFLKVDVGSKENRDSIPEKAKLLKKQSEPWLTVYIKKDVHPVQYQENKRMRQKVKSLCKTFPDKDVKILKGKLLIAGDVVDKNTFFV